MNLPKLDSPFAETYAVCSKKATPLHTKYYVTRAERAELTEAIGDAGVILYEFYVRLASYDHPVITDEITAYSLCWNTRKVRRYREALSKAGWFAQSKYTLANDTKGMAYYIGKAAVTAHKGDETNV